MRFKKGELNKESYKVIMHDLELLTSRDQETFNYHYELLKGNLKDIFGMKQEDKK